MKHELNVDISCSITSCYSDVFLPTVPPKLIGEEINLSDRRPIITAVVINSTTSFYCPIEGDPKPVITWQRNGEDLLDDGKRFFISDEGRNLTILNAEITDKARYTCNARNTAGETEKSFNLEVHSKMEYSN